MKRTRISLSKPLMDTLRGIAAAEGRAVTHVIEQLVRERLLELGVLGPPTPEQMAAALAAEEMAEKSAPKKVKPAVAAARTTTRRPPNFSAV